jgi:hypothetical protein
LGDAESGSAESPQGQAGGFRHASIVARFSARKVLLLSTRSREECVGIISRVLEHEHTRLSDTGIQLASGRHVAWVAQESPNGANTLFVTQTI